MSLLTNSKNVVATTNNIINTKKNINKIEQVLNYIPVLFKAKPVVAVLRLYGIIGRMNNYKQGLSIEVLNDLIEKAFNLQKLKAVCLAINSPGGSPVQSELIANRIIELSKEKQIPVYSFVEDLAASGGYWLACAGSEIYASKSSIIGSIGVISNSFGFHEAISKIGVERRVYTEGKNKSILDPFQPVKPNDVKIIKHLQKQIHEHFIHYVKERRSSKLTQGDHILFTGEFWSGENAADFGLIDGINNMYNFIRHKFDKNITIQYITPKQSWFKKTLGMTESNTSQEIVDRTFDKVENWLIKNKFNLF